MIPEHYDITYVPGRKQPFTCWYLRLVGNKREKECFFFSASYSEALDHCVNDEPGD